MSAAAWDRIEGDGVRARTADGAGAGCLRSLPAGAVVRGHLMLVPPPSASSQPAPLKLTRRGRVVVGLLGLMLVAMLSVFVTAAASSATPGAARTVTVAPGETLSEIAERELPAVSTQQGVVDFIMENHMQSDQVSAGQTLTVPTR